MNTVTIKMLYLPECGKPNEWLNMSQKKFPQIQENYAFYNNLLLERKSIFAEVIEINQTGNNRNTLAYSTIVSHPNVEDDAMVLMVNVKVNNHDFFQFKLRYQPFVPAPFFRFDSDGETHRNKIEGIALEQQSITTPHFHKFNENGVEIAFKTDKLKDPKESAALEDINLCIKHFCHEANLRFQEDGFPEIIIGAGTLAFKITKEDPNQNITFL
jgi:hypothetical protein